MRRRTLVYLAAGILGVCVICGIFAALRPRSVESPPTEPAQRAATIAQATNTPVPSPTIRPTRTAAPAATTRPTRAPSGTPVPPTDTPPTAAPATAAPAASCPDGCTEQKPGCDIKGNVNSEHQRIYHKPGMRDYNKTKVQLDEGDRWFCTEAEAQAAGFRRAGQ